MLRSRKLQLQGKDDLPSSVDAGTGDGSGNACHGQALRWSVSVALTAERVACVLCLLPRPVPAMEHANKKWCLHVYRSNGRTCSCCTVLFVFDSRQYYLLGRDLMILSVIGLPDLSLAQHTGRPVAEVIVEQSHHYRKLSPTAAQSVHRLDLSLRQPCMISAFHI